MYMYVLHVEKVNASCDKFLVLDCKKWRRWKYSEPSLLHTSFQILNCTILLLVFSSHQQNWQSGLGECMVISLNQSNMKKVKFSLMNVYSWLSAVLHVSGAVLKSVEVQWEFKFFIILEFPAP